MYSQNIQIAVLGCSVLYGYQYFRETYYLHLRGGSEQSYDFIG